ncbi:MAG: Hsp20/alpha crystallin family protein [Acidiferrobacterales bacterium]|nr:Hsp20/alpha crystallin family protein [Acidiferrobacterales bacterium]
MSTLDQLRHGLGQLRNSLLEGWQQLRERTLQAVTHFKLDRSSADVETRQEQIMSQASRWGLIAAEVRETADAVQVSLEVPGMDKDDFDISVVEDYLVVRGQKHMDSERSEGRFHIMECAYGQFERVVELPVHVDDARASARYRHGVLSVTLPKSKSAIRRQIAVDEH